MAGSVAFLRPVVKRAVGLGKVQGRRFIHGGSGEPARESGTSFGGKPPHRETLPIIGRTEDGGWWQVQAKNGPAWISATVVLAAHSAEVPVVSAPALSG
jgi:hypothetical protein